jgi:hypothetical protein
MVDLLVGGFFDRQRSGEFAIGVDLLLQRRNLLLGRCDGIGTR